MRQEGVFRWQDVACCPEHGRVYLERVTAARSGDEPVDARGDTIDIVTNFETAHASEPDSVESDNGTSDNKQEDGVTPERRTNGVTFKKKKNR